MRGPSSSSSSSPAPRMWKIQFKVSVRALIMNQQAFVTGTRVTRQCPFTSRCGECGFIGEKPFNLLARKHATELFICL